MWFWKILLLLLTIYIIYRFLTFSGKYSVPPGPIGWPLVGNAFNVSTSRAAQFTDLSKTYGGIFSLKFFGRTFVVLSDANTIRDAQESVDVSSKILTKRPSSFLTKYTILGKTTPFLAADEKWESRRHLLAKKINIYTDGIQLSESALKQELGRVVEWIGSHKENSVDLSPVLLASLVNTSAILLLGKRFQLESKEVKVVCDVISLTEQLSDIRVDGLMSALPCLRNIPILYGASYKKLLNNLSMLKEIFYTQPKNECKSGASRGLLDLLLKAKESNNNNERGGAELTDDDVMEMVLDILTNSVPKIHAALLNFFWITLHKPAVALKIQRELEKVTDSRRPPTLRDRERMPYTEATVLELLRFSSPVGFTRYSAIADTKVAEYQIPEKSTVIVDIRAAQRDTNTWDDPTAFRPERFLNESGNLIAEHSLLRKNLMAMGLGKRKCIGQAFSVSRLFLYISTLLQQFNFRQPEGETTQGLEECMALAGNLIKPSPFKVKVFRHLYKIDFYRTEKSSP